MQGCNLQESEMDLKARFAALLPNVQICHSWMRTGLFLCQRRDPQKQRSSHPNTPEALHLILRVYTYSLIQWVWWTWGAKYSHEDLLNVTLQYFSASFMPNTDITTWHTKFIYEWGKLILWQICFDIQSFNSHSYQKKSKLWHWNYEKLSQLWQKQLFLYQFWIFVNWHLLS